MARPKIGLVLGSGSARGWAHIGVIRELEHMGIKPDLVTGSSVGALVGGAYASDHLNELMGLAVPQHQGHSKAPRQYSEKLICSRYHNEMMAGSFVQLIS